MVSAHDQIGEQAGLYVLGALTPSERQAFEGHLAVCASCAAEVRALTRVVDAIGEATPGADPSPDVRARLLSRVAATGSTPAQPAARRSGWFAAAAAIVFAIGLGAYTGELRGRISVLETRLRQATLRADGTERQLADARRTAFDAQTARTVLTAPDLARIDLAGQPAAPRAAARAFWSRSNGLVFTASNLPAPPPGRVYQLWVLSAQPAPISAGLMTPDANGLVNAMFRTPADLPAPVAMAVTLEPEGGVPSPTGDKFLVGLAH
jgi:anti-sigma-K factor RskA